MIHIYPFSTPPSCSTPLSRLLPDCIHGTFNLSACRFSSPLSSFTSSILSVFSVRLFPSSFDGDGYVESWKGARMTPYRKTLRGHAWLMTCTNVVEMSRRHHLIMYTTAASVNLIPAVYCMAEQSLRILSGTTLESIRGHTITPHCCHHADVFVHRSYNHGRISFSVGR